jgi:hypothetical protein
MGPSIFPSGGRNRSSTFFSSVSTKEQIMVTINGHDLLDGKKRKETMEEWMAIPMTMALMVFSFD